MSANHIFISHASKDDTFVKELRLELSPISDEPVGGVPRMMVPAPIERAVRDTGGLTG